jgi:hypothetical protein
MSATYHLVRSPLVERVLGDVDLVGIVLSKLLGSGTDDLGLLLATRAVHSLCLTSKPVRAAVLASVQRVGIDTPLPGVLLQLPSLVSLHVGPGPFDTVAELLQLTRLKAGMISSPQPLSTIVHQTRLPELVPPQPPQPTRQFS